MKETELTSTDALRLFEENMELRIRLQLALEEIERLKTPTPPPFRRGVA